MFTDEITVTFVAGKGGNGVVAWIREKFVRKGGPCGGNGGRGGSVYLKTSKDLYSLDPYLHKKIICAEDGKAGGERQKQGKQGRDKIIQVPCGTLVKDAHSGELLHDLTEPNMTLELCAGGKGGLGNTFFKSPTNRAPTKCTPGKLGQQKDITLELKLLADVGFVGLPNAGKSTLLGQLTKLPIKTGAYPFTTLSPNLRWIEFEDYTRITLADIPGLIKGAHRNKGLGFQFLRHIERARQILFLIDGSGIDDRTPWDDYHTLQEELTLYKEGLLLQKPHLVVYNKIDTPQSQEYWPLFLKHTDLNEEQVLQISAQDQIGLEALLKRLQQFTIPHPASLPTY